MSGSVAVASYPSFLEPHGLFCGDASLASLQSPTSGDLQRPPSSSHRHGTKVRGGSSGSRGETGDFSSPRRCASPIERRSGGVRFVEPTASHEWRGDGPVINLPRSDARSEDALPADAHAARGAERHCRKKMRKCQEAAAETLPREEGCGEGAAAPTSSEDEDVVMSVHAEPEGGAGGVPAGGAGAADSFVGGAWLWQASLAQGTVPAAAVTAPAPAVGISVSSIDSPSGAAPAVAASTRGPRSIGPRSILRSTSAAAARRARVGRVAFAPSVKGHCGLRPLSRALDQLVWRFFGSRLGAPVSFPVPEVPPLPGASLPVLWAEVAAGPAARAVITALTTYQPPADVLPAAAAILTDPALAGGCPRALRGLLRAVEGLHVRLLEAILRDRLPAGTLDDENNDGNEAAQPHLAAAPTPFDDSDDGSDEDLLEGAAAEAARRAEAAAAAYAAKRREPTAPVLPGGGGTCAKLSAAHVSWVQQLVMLLRHAVLLAPPPVGDADEDYDEL